MARVKKILDNMGKGPMRRPIKSGWQCEKCGHNQGMTYEPIRCDGRIFYHVAAHCNNCHTLYNVRQVTDDPIVPALMDQGLL